MYYNSSLGIHVSGTNGRTKEIQKSIYLSEEKRFKRSLIEGEYNNNAYPEAQAMLERTNFYRSTFALLQALYGLRNGDLMSFEDGISEYI